MWRPSDGGSPSEGGVGSRRACGPRAFAIFYFFCVRERGDRSWASMGAEGKWVVAAGGGGGSSRRRGVGEVAGFWFLQGVLGGGRRGGRNGSGFGFLFFYFYFF